MAAPGLALHLLELARDGKEERRLEDGSLVFLPNKALLRRLPQGSAFPALRLIEDHYGRLGVVLFQDDQPQFDMVPHHGGRGWVISRREHRKFREWHDNWSKQG